MQYHSTNRQVLPATFEQAVIDGLAKDKGLFMPESVPALPAAFFADLPSLSLGDIARKVARLFIEDEIPEAVLGQLAEEALNFPIPLVSLAPHLHVLELFHGPTLAFKDVGARFMSRVMAHFLRGVDKKVYVLVATSGDTGSAVAQGFYNVPGIEVIILYPSGKVSRVQEAQFATLGNNVTALEVEGTFDDCQRLVKTAFSDAALREELYLTSANSINFARLLPQSFYYFYAYGQLAAKVRDPEVVFSVPSGNYGNLTAGLLAEKMGLPGAAFLAASNANDTVPEYLTTRTFRPRPSVATLSNAMDVGDPSNFARMQRLFGDSWEDMQKRIRGYSFHRRPDGAGHPRSVRHLRLPHRPARGGGLPGRRRLPQKAPRRPPGDTGHGPPGQVCRRRARRHRPGAARAAPTRQLPAPRKTFPAPGQRLPAAKELPAATE
jgi:threonine synthase